MTVVVHMCAWISVHQLQCMLPASRCLGAFGICTCCLAVDVQTMWAHGHDQHLHVKGYIFLNNLFENSNRRVVAGMRETSKDERISKVGRKTVMTLAWAYALSFSCSIWFVYLYFSDGFLPGRLLSTAADACWSLSSNFLLYLGMVKLKVSYLTLVAKQANTAFLHGPTVWKVADRRDQTHGFSF